MRSVHFELNIPVLNVSLTLLLQSTLSVELVACCKYGYLKKIGERGGLERKGNQDAIHCEFFRFVIKEIFQESGPSMFTVSLQV